MESVTTRFSHQPNKASATFSKKITSNLYDDVYGAPPRFASSSSASISPRFEDYGEIFSSFHAARASSIPVLDLPPVDGAGAFFDSGIAGFDYAEVFRGFSGLDFWTSHEDLFRGDGFSDEEEAWTQVETDSFSKDLEHVVNNQGISDIDFFQSVNGGREFNVSYHKVSGTRSEDTSKGKTHTAQLHAVPGFSHVVEETTRFLRTDPSLQVVDDTELDVERNAGKAKGNRLRKSMSRRPGNLTSGEGEQVLGSDLDMHDGCRRNGSHSSETFVAVSDISLRTIPSELPPPSRPPPVLDASRGHSSGFHSKSERVDDGETLGYSSPPFYDVEVDINSSSAAMKNAMHRPAAKLKNAEEFRGRKKGASETNTKSSYRVKNDEAKISEITRFDSLNDDRKQESCDVRSGNMKISATDESQKATKVAPETSEPLERERLVNMFEEKHIKESRSSLESDRSTAVGTWKEETEFFELVGTEEHGKVIRPINHTTSLMQDTKTYEHGRKVGEAPNIQEEYKNVKAIAEGYQVEDKKKSKAAKMALEQGKSIRKSKSSNEKYRQRENVKNDKMTEFFELQKNEKKTRTVHQHGKTGNIATKADQSDSLREIAETQHKEHQKVESAKSKEVDRQTRIEVQCSMDHKDNEKKLKEDEDQQLSVKRQKQKQSQKMKENGKIVREAFALGTAEGEERVKDSENLDRIDERVNEPLKIDRPEEKTTCKRENEIIFKQAKQIKSKKGLKEAYESKTIEKSLEGSFKKGESDQGLKYALGKIENEMGLEEDFELELSKKSTTEVFYQEGNEQYERDQANEKCREVFNEYGKGNILKKAGHSEKIQKVQKQAPELERNGGNEAQRKKEIESPSNPAFDREGSVDISNEDSHAEKSEKMLKDTGSEKDKGLDKDLEQIQADGEGVDMEFSKEINETLETEYDESLLAAHSSSIHEEKMGKLEASEEPIADPENGKARTDCKVDEKKLEEIGVENLLANVRKQASEISLGEVEHSGTQSGRVDHKMTNADGLGFCSEKTCTEKTNIVSPMEFGPDSQERELAHEWGERGNIKQHANAGLNHEQIREQESSSQANPCGDDRRNTVADAPGIVRKAASVQNSCQRSYVAHSTKSKDKSLDETPAAVEKDAERTRREVELEKDRLRKIEEEIERERERHKDRMAVNRAMLEAEREREREKDRMAVDRATLEARDRAYTEARERAERAAFERATAEARQRALGEARERLEKACAEARDKSFADKAAAEAKLKAERAAVERATAEARERAMEKVKVERAVFESRERLERSVSEKFGVSFRNDGRQGSSSSGMLDPHVQNFNSSTGSRYPYSSVYGASSFSERSGGEGETAQRCRARLERYQRTAERAAKALEEKNTRDLIAQREQAERNRLAETLDAEVRRWSSGKEGNLRALLSTLQYILGHDSGWQPIPLTEVITSAAVKKAYRKATLCVHPDKLQQRGASVQHKYTCEKVFDLLKDAWTKFNSEER